MMTRPAARYRLTDAGKRLWRYYHELTLIECTEADFIDKVLTDPVAISGTCGSCGVENCNMLVLGLFCVACTAGSVDEKSK